MISLDVGVTKDGWVADAAITVPVGPVNPGARELLDATKEALVAGAAEARPGNHLGDISAAIQRHVESQGFSIIRSLVGHGIGRDMHEDPQIPNYGEPGKGPELERRHGAGDRADGQRRRPGRSRRRRQLGRLLGGWLAGRPLRVHRRRDRGRAPRS